MRPVSSTAKSSTDPHAPSLRWPVGLSLLAHAVLLAGWAAHSVTHPVAQLTRVGRSAGPLTVQLVAAPVRPAAAVLAGPSVRSARTLPQAVRVASHPTPEPLVTGSVSEPPPPDASAAPTPAPAVQGIALGGPLLPGWGAPVRWGQRPADAMPTATPAALAMAAAAAQSVLIQTEQRQAAARQLLQALQQQLAGAEAQAEPEAAPCVLPISTDAPCTAALPESLQQRLNQAARTWQATVPEAPPLVLAWAEGGWRLAPR